MTLADLAAEEDRLLQRATANIVGAAKRLSPGPALAS
jgi:hypothetical protein